VNPAATRSRHGTTIRAYPRNDGSTSRGNTTPREQAMGRRAPEENAFLSSLRPNINGRTAGRVYSNRASSAPRERQPNWQESHDRQAYTKANRAWAGSDEAHKFNSNRTASAHFADSLRDWPRATDVAKKTPPNWRVSAADTFGGRDLFGTSADDLSLNNAEDWKHSNKIRADELFHAGLRGVDKNASWQGQDVGYDDQGRPKKQQAKRNDKDVKNLTVGNVGDSIIRQPENMFGPWQNMVRSDEYYHATLRDFNAMDRKEYLERRRRHLKLPAQAKELSTQQKTAARRAFANLCVAFDPAEAQRLTEALGHHSPAVDKKLETIVGKLDQDGAKGKEQLRQHARQHHDFAL